MKFTGLIPMLWTDNLDETVRFYVHTLGFTVGERNDEWGWAAMHRDDTEIMVAKPNEHTPFTKPVFTGSFYIYTTDVDALWEELKDKTKVCYSIDNFDWQMREFAIHDNNGYILQFGQRIE